MIVMMALVAPAFTQIKGAGDVTSLLFGAAYGSYLYCSWPDCIKVAKVYSMHNNMGGIVHQVDLLVELSTHCYVLVSWLGVG